MGIRSRSGECGENLLASCEVTNTAYDYIQKVGKLADEIETVANNTEAIKTANTNAASISSVAQNIDNVNRVGSDIDSVKSLADDMSKVDATLAQMEIKASGAASAANLAEKSADRSEDHKKSAERAALASAASAVESQSYASQSATYLLKHRQLVSNVEATSKGVTDKLTDLGDTLQEAKQSEGRAKLSAIQAAGSADTAKQYVGQIKDSVTLAAGYADNAHKEVEKVQVIAGAAQANAVIANTAATETKTYLEAAKKTVEHAENHMTYIIQGVNTVSGHASTSLQDAIKAAASADTAKLQADSAASSARRAETAAVQTEQNTALVLKTQLDTSDLVDSAAQSVKEVVALKDTIAASVVKLGTSLLRTQKIVAEHHAFK